MQTNKRVGVFIQELRQDKKISTEQLAKKLDVSENEILDWEKGRTAPDISYLQPLASYFKVTVDELIEGKRYVEGEEMIDQEMSNKKIIKYASETQAEKYKNLRLQLIFLISAVMLLIVFSSVSIDLIISRSISWSGIVGLSILFVWLTILPLFTKTKQPIKVSMISFSALVIPYLIGFDYVLNLEGLLMKLAVPIGLSLLAYIWGLYYAYRHLKLSWMNLVGIAFLGAGLISLVVDITMSVVFGRPFFTWTNFFISLILFALAGLILYLDRNSKQPAKEKD